MFIKGKASVSLSHLPSLENTQDKSVYSYSLSPFLSPPFFRRKYTKKVYRGSTHREGSTWRDGGKEVYRGKESRSRIVTVVTNNETQIYKLSYRPPCSPV